MNLKSHFSLTSTSSYEMLLKLFVPSFVMKCKVEGRGIAKKNRKKPILKTESPKVLVMSQEYRYRAQLLVFKLVFRDIKEV